MKKQIINLLFVLAGAAGLTSCENWLDETSNSEIREEDHFATEEGFRQSLIGCYINMTDESLYGKELSWGLVETLGRQFQPFTTTASSSNYYLQNYNYKHSTAVGRVENIWAKAYNVIANANAALAVIDEKETMMNPTNYSVFKGEFLAIRAYMHFELMRLYGYGNWAGRKAEIDGKYAVPYVTTVSKNTTDQVKTSEFFKLLIADLEEAAKYLAEDPVTGKHEWSHYEELNEDGFYDYRNLHLNYYAVKALQARVYLWDGSAASKEKALAAATEVIDDYFTNTATANTIVRWMGDTDFNNYPAMALEHIFGLNINSDKFSNLTASYLKTAIADTDYDAYYMTNDDTYAIYENSNTDYRFTKLLQSQLNGTRVGFLPLKLHQTDGAQQLYSNRIPLLRMPEMYYIAAECHLANDDVEAALNLLTVVRNQRGVYDALDATMSVEAAMEEIKKEYHKEYLLEGVMFYYYKRTGADMLPNMETPMTDAEYVLPYPEFELQNGRVQ